MKTKILLLFTLINLIFPKSYAQTEVSAFFRGENFRYADISASVIEVESGSSIVEYNAHKRMIPASVLKLFTTAAALCKYGSEYRFYTPFYYTGNIAQGVLNGNLIIEGSGDPTLDSRYFTRQQGFVDYVLSVLKKKGVTGIKGNIILDNSLYSTEVSSPKWLWEDMGNYYGSGVWAINYRDNQYALTFRSGLPGTRPEVVSVDPEVPDMIITPSLTAASNSKDSAYIYGAPFQKERFVYGSIPANRSKFTIKGDMYDPNMVLASELKKRLSKDGVILDGVVKTNYASPLMGVMLDEGYASPALGEIVRTVNFNSNNLFADGLLRLIGQNDKNRPVTFSQGVDRAFALWNRIGLDKGGARIFDGSGLSPMNRITTHYLANLLSLTMKEKTIRDVFYYSLPVPGKDGTVKSFLKDWNKDGRFRLKSGSMGGVLSYAGYLDKNGKRYAVVIIVNNFDVSHSVVRAGIEKWLMALDMKL